jgi:hypothetical protein
MGIARVAANNATKKKPLAALNVGWKNFLDVRHACSKTNRLPNKQAKGFGRRAQCIESKRN